MNYCILFSPYVIAVTAFDISEQGIEKAKRLAEYNKVEVGFFKADILDYRPDSEYDIIFSSGALHIIPPADRKEFCDSLKTHTTDIGINALNVFVQKPFIALAPDSTKEEEKAGTPYLNQRAFQPYFIIIPICTYINTSFPTLSFFLLVYTILVLSLVQSLVHFFDIVPAPGILYNPYNGKNEGKNSEIT